MNPINKITFALLAAAAAGALQAQQESPSSAMPSASDNPGVLGQNYTDLSFGVQDLRHTSDNAFDATLRGNIPVSRSVDVGLGYSYNWIDGNSDNHSHLLATDAKFYVPMENHMKPFIGGLVGYQWAKTRFDNQFPIVSTTDDRWTWGADAGVEMPVGSVALTPHVGYIDTMQNNSVGHYNYGVEANHWFSSSVGGYADVSYNDLRHQDNTWTYLVGLRLRY